VRFDMKTPTSFRSGKLPASFRFHSPIEIWIGRRPQEQAKILLERAISGRDRAPAQTEAEIEARLDSWQGKLHWDAELGRLITAALNSEDRAVRTSAIEVQLAAYGLAQNNSSVDALEQQANSSNHAQKVWALWALGLLGNRGVETDRVVQVLTSHLNARDSSKELNANTNTASTKERREANYKDDEDSRVWAVEGLGLVGTNATIAPLLDALRNDPSKTVRERAACSLAESGMLSREQRLTTVPQLINDSDDPNLDSQTHAWAFQALIDITKQHLPNDSSAWRDWYQKSVASGQ
jgi:HEAT repeat protein